MKDNYEDIINLGHPTSSRHPRMSSSARASQFAPFAALTGFEDAVVEEGRITSSKVNISLDIMDDIDNKLRILREKIKEKPNINISYFVKDNVKTGGKYVNVSGVIKKIDDYNGELIMCNGECIIIDNIIDISSNDIVFDDIM